MGRPPNSKNKVKSTAKNGAAPSAPREAPRKQGAASKPNEPTPEQNAAWQAQLESLETEKQRIAGDISALSTQVKKAAGIKRWKSIKWMVAHRSNKAEAKEFLEDLVQVAAQNEIRIEWMGNQATFGDIMDQNAPPAKNTTGSRDLAAARAHSDGFNSGRNGAIPSDNPHPPGSEQYVNWHDGRDEGQQAREVKNPGAAIRVVSATTADDRLPSDPDAVQF